MRGQREPLGASEVAAGAAASAATTQLPNVPGWMARFWATWTIGLFVSKTFRTAPARNSRS